MKRFRFSLRAVSVLRTHQEMRAREAFATSVQAFVRSEEALAVVRNRLHALEHALTAGRATTFPAAEEIRALAAYRDECAAEVEAEKARVAAERAMHDRRSDYIEAHRRLEVVHRLEEKAKAVHRYETMREEQAEFDDYSNRRFGRHSLESA